MSFLNLSLAEFLAVFLPIGAAVVALYLYDRSHRRQIVSTLRFFERVSQSPVFTRRKKIQQPWSLLLQLVSLLLLLLAIAEIQLGRRADRARDHVLILEASAWMNSVDRSAPGSAPGPRSLMQTARRRAVEYLRAVPGQDRVMLIRADQLATPLTPFTRNRRELETAIRAFQAGSTALNLRAALELARSSQRRASARPGEIVVVGSGRVMPADLERLGAADASGVRAILLGGDPNNCGIRKLSARRSVADPLTWEIDAGAYNYGSAEHRPVLRLAFGGSRVASKRLTLPPHSGAEASFSFRATQPGLLEAVLDSKDDYQSDNRAAIELPKFSPLKIQIFTAKPKLWQPLLTASLFLVPEFHAPGEYTASGPTGRLVILDGFKPSIPPSADSVWITPLEDGARRTLPLHVLRWNASHPIVAGLHNKDVRVSKAVVLEAKPSEMALAESEGGPVLLASSGGEFKRVVFGFHPLEEGTDNHVAIPLLFANLVRWVSPEVFRASEISVNPPGLIELEVPPETRREQVHVTSAQIRGLSFTLIGKRLRFFAGQAGTVHVTMPERELVYMLNRPEVGEAR